MPRLIVVAFAALCLFGTSSLALAEDAMKSEEVMGARKADMKDAEVEKGSMEGKGAMSARQAGQGGETGYNPGTRGEVKKEHKEKTKKHKDAAKAPAAPAPAP